MWAQVIRTHQDSIASAFDAALIAGPRYLPVRSSLERRRRFVEPMEYMQQAAALRYPGPIPSSRSRKPTHIVHLNQLARTPSADLQTRSRTPAATPAQPE